jgi:serine/threonine-protein kinase RIO1
MKDKFDSIVESFYPSTMKFVTRVRYPKQIQFSEEFQTALKKEFSRLQTLKENETESPQPIRNYRDKFLKAVNFCIRAL